MYRKAGEYLAGLAYRHGMFSSHVLAGFAGRLWPKDELEDSALIKPWAAQL